MDDLDNIFECSICCSEFSKICKKKINFILCPQCNQIFCLDCQKKYSKSDCMNCHMEFKSKFLEERLGKSFIEKNIKPKIMSELMIEQKDTLKNVQPLVEWEREVRKQKKNARFGIPSTIPDRPSIQTITDLNQIFPCPGLNCRGFVAKGVCGICQIHVCLQCREIQAENHICNIDTLQSIAALAKDSKPCPKCCAIIYRTEGCNHMFCTNCRTHFDWIIGKILKTSTNGHYLHLQQFSQNVSIREIATDEISCDESRFSIYQHRISIDDIETDILPVELVHALWNDSNSIRLAKRKLYNEPTIQVDTAENLQELQVKYLLGDITEEHWSRQVYQIVRKKTLCLLYAEIFNIYLETVDNLQMQCVAKNPTLNEIIDNYKKLIELCNESFISIADEYGGSIHRFRGYEDNSNDAPFI
jgi:hypothetical protein